MIRRSFIKWQLPALLWAVILLGLTWYPHVEIPDIGLDYKDKIAHIICFGLLALLFCRAVSRFEINRLPKAIKTTLIYCSLFAIIDEWGQSFIPGRFSTFSDGLANLIGVVLAIPFFQLILFPLQQKLNFSKQVKP